MKFDRFIQALLPHDEKFFSYFEESMKNLVDASMLLTKIPSASETERKHIISQIHDCEHKGDAVAHEIFAALNRTFITPFDREDIHVLTSALDDILDYLDGSAARFTLYKIKECPPAMEGLIKVLFASIGELQRGVAMLHDIKKFDELRLVLRKVNEYENEADSIFEEAIAELFDGNYDAIMVIKLKEIYVALETATDKCEDAANVLESILIKNA